jgi:hypothetical protein
VQVTSAKLIKSQDPRKPTILQLTYQNFGKLPAEKVLIAAAQSNKMSLDRYTKMISKAIAGPSGTMIEDKDIQEFSDSQNIRIGSMAPGLSQMFPLSASDVSLEDATGPMLGAIHFKVKGTVGYLDVRTKTEYKDNWCFQDPATKNSESSEIVLVPCQPTTMVIHQY